MIVKNENVIHLLEYSRVDVEYPRLTAIVSNMYTYTLIGYGFPKHIMQWIISSIAIEKYLFTQPELRCSSHNELTRKCMEPMPMRKARRNTQQGDRTPLPYQRQSPDEFGSLLSMKE